MCRVKAWYALLVILHWAWVMRILTDRRKEDDMANDSANCQRGAVPVIMIVILAAAAILGVGIVGFLLGRGVQ